MVIGIILVAVGIFLIIKAANEPMDLSVDDWEE